MKEQLITVYFDFTAARGGRLYEITETCGIAMNGQHQWEGRTWERHGFGTPEQINLLREKLAAFKWVKRVEVETGNNHLGG